MKKKIIKIISPEEKILIFDGECLLCNSFIQFLDRYLITKFKAYSFFKNFRKDHTLIANFLDSNSINPEKTILIIYNQRLYTHSSAIYKILSLCRPKYIVYFSIFIKFFEKIFLGDLVYKIISRYRKSFFKMPKNYCIRINQNLQLMD